jgi:diguanylate cyclase (GGDEF)-like protein
MQTNAMDAVLDAIIRHKRVTSVFQPIIDCKEGTILGYEALSRGPSDSPLHSPAAMFNNAARLGRLSELELVCREQSVYNFFRKQLSGLLFLNVSPMALTDPDYPRGKSVELLQKLGHSPSRIVIELSEKYPMEDTNALCKMLEYYRSMGFKTAIDDLGSGYAGLRLWSELRPDYVKIDGHFIANIDNDPVKREFVRGIIELSDNIGCQVIAEGVETAEEHDTVSQMGINIAQGFYFAKPKEDPDLEVPHPVLMSSSSPGVLPRYNETAHSLCVHVDPVSPEMKLLDAWELLSDECNVASLPVVEEGRPLGLLHRSAVLKTLSSQYGRALHGDKPLRKFLNNNCISVERDALLDEISDRITSEDDMYVRQHFLITQQGKYVGMGNSRDLLKRITDLKLKHARYANPLTLLPGNVPIKERLAELVRAERYFELVYFDINNFKPYNDIYGYRKDDQVIQVVGRLLLDFCTSKKDFIGHIGGDDFIGIYMEHDARTICRKVFSEFEKCLPQFYNDEHLAAGRIKGENRSGETIYFPLLSLSAGIVPFDRSISTAELYADCASEAKCHAKEARPEKIHIHGRPALTEPGSELDGIDGGQSDVLIHQDHIAVRVEQGEAGRP